MRFYGILVVVCNTMEVEVPGVVIPHGDRDGGTTRPRTAERQRRLAPVHADRAEAEDPPRRQAPQQRGVVGQVLPRDLAGAEVIGLGQGRWPCCAMLGLRCGWHGAAVAQLWVELTEYK
jgi:hypothetical protein